MMPKKKFKSKSRQHACNAVIAKLEEDPDNDALLSDSKA